VSEGKKRAKYDVTLPGRMYRYFAAYEETGVPSFTKFARASGFTTEELNEFRKHPKFDRAWRECSEIRRDYLIDMALTKRHDPTFTKFLLGNESAGEGTDGAIDVTLEVI